MAGKLQSDELGSQSVTISGGKCIGGAFDSKVKPQSTDAPGSVTVPVLPIPFERPTIL